MRHPVTLCSDTERMSNQASRASPCTGLPDEPEDWSKRALELHLNLEVLLGHLQKHILTRLST